MARKAKYDWGKSRDGRYQKFETRISTKLTATNASSPYADSGYCDIAQCLSLINRKLVRQGHVFKVKGMKIYSKDESPVTTAKIGVLPRTWMMFNAYKKARSLFLRQAEQAHADTGLGQLPRYLDFKVLMDEGHVLNFNAGTDIMLPMDFDENMVSTTDTDWDYSKLFTADASSDDMKLHVLGRHLLTDGSTFDASLTGYSTLDSAGLIMAYQQSRTITRTDIAGDGNKQQDSQALQRGPFGSIDATDDQKADLLTFHGANNDNPPYDYNEYAGGPSELKEATTVWTGRIPQKAVANAVTVPTFEAPLGLIRVEVDGPSALDAEEVEIHFDTEIIGAI